MFFILQGFFAVCTEDGGVQVWDFSDGQCEDYENEEDNGMVYYNFLCVTEKSKK